MRYWLVAMTKKLHAEYAAMKRDGVLRLPQKSDKNTTQMEVGDLFYIYTDGLIVDAGEITGDWYPGYVPWAGQAPDPNDRDGYHFPAAFAASPIARRPLASFVQGIRLPYLNPAGKLTHGKVHELPPRIGAQMEHELRSST